MDTAKTLEVHVLEIRITKTNDPDELRRIAKRLHELGEHEIARRAEKKSKNNQK